MQAPSTGRGAETADERKHKKQCARPDKKEPCVHCGKNRHCATCTIYLCNCASPPTHVQCSDSQLYCVGECVPDVHRVAVIFALGKQFSTHDEQLENAREVLAAQLEKIQALEQQLDRANQKIEELQKAAPVCVVCESTTKMCCVCMDQRADIACLPCGHLCYCQKCQKNSTCPYCRTTPTGWQRVYT